MSGKVLTAANGITVFRIFLFFGFVWMLFRHDLTWALILFAAAWALDAVDGYVARAMNQASKLGSQLDKFTDRLIIGLSVLFLIRMEFLPPEALLIITKDISLLPAVTLHAMRNESVQGMGIAGKIMTFLQGAAIVWLLLNWPYGQAVIGFVAVTGFYAAWRHLRFVQKSKVQTQPS